MVWCNVSIEFWRTKEFYGWMSNFSRHLVLLDGVTYVTSEHAYQALKFTDPEDQKFVAAAATPGQSKQRNIQLAHKFDKPRWDKIHLQVMKTVLKAKLSSNPMLVKALLDTGDEELIEASPVDPYWGWGADRKGLNMLGKLWMEIRTELQSKS